MSDTPQEPNAPENDISIPPGAIHCVSGLIYQVLRPGAGDERPGPEDLAQVLYKARTKTGQLFDASGEAPKTWSLSEIGPGLAETLQLMTVSQRMRVWISPSLASAERREANEGTSIYDIELVGFTRMKEYPSIPIELTSPRKED